MTEDKFLMYGLPIVIMAMVFGMLAWVVADSYNEKNITELEQQRIDKLSCEQLENELITGNPTIKQTYLEKHLRQYTEDRYYECDGKTAIYTVQELHSQYQEAKIFMKVLAHNEPDNPAVKIYMDDPNNHWSEGEDGKCIDGFTRVAMYKHNELISSCMLDKFIDERAIILRDDGD